MTKLCVAAIECQNKTCSESTTQYVLTAESVKMEHFIRYLKIKRRCITIAGEFREKIYKKAVGTC